MPIIVGNGIEIGNGITITSGNAAPPAPYVTENLVLYYDPNNPASYPGTGNTVYNLAPYNMPGTMTNVSWTDPYFSFSLANSRITVADNALLNPGTGELSIEIWYMTNGYGNSPYIPWLLGKFDENTSTGYAMEIFPTQNPPAPSTLSTQFSCGFGAINHAVTPSDIIYLNQWSQYGVTWKYNGATQELAYFHDGVFQTLQQTMYLPNPVTTTAPLKIGGKPSDINQSGWFIGRIGAIRIYNSVLTSQQILQNFNASKSLYSPHTWQ